MAYFVTGATGFIGRNLMARLLERHEGDIYVLVRRDSVGRLRELSDHYWPARVEESARRTGATKAIAPTTNGVGRPTPAKSSTLAANGKSGSRPGAPSRSRALSERIHAVTGDLRQPMLGLDREQIEALQGSIDHFFHLAALYDMTASAAENTDINVAGTAHAVELARAIEARHLHHVSSVAVAGSYDGLYSESMFDVGQKLPTPYHRTKFEAERLVREQPYVPWRIYRPSIVVGDSQTGEIDKIDGPYYFFKAMQRMGRLLPEWLPLVGLDLGNTNIVPVDWVCDAMDHLAHKRNLDGSTFHLVDPVGQPVDWVLNQVAAAAHGPQFAVTVNKRVVGALPAAPLALALRAPGLKQLKEVTLREVGIPEEVLSNMGLAPELESELTQKALSGTTLQKPPPLQEYLPRLWSYWERELDIKGPRGRTLHDAVAGKHVLITGASSGIGAACAMKIAAAGGVPLLVARNVERLERTQAEIVAAGGAAYVYAADLSDMEDIDRLLERIFAENRTIDGLVNNAGRSIRRSIALSYERFHDFERTMQLNYFGAVRLIIGVLPHMRERGRGHIVNVSTIGVQASPPRFSAYVASKAALDAFTRVVASETIGDGVTFTTIHMPLVRTPMIEPTKMYKAFPAISPEEAADMICEALRSHPKQIGTRLGTTSEVLYALAPKMVDRILHTGYRVFPESAAARGEKALDERATLEQIAMATLTRGVHW
jgi:NAD(P)-dependent dehydrogenase (short-subunit alcohol dehydrogenase family)